ncbi:MAG TPA: DegT/DnrJ/EryC1/StrS family aminotransferase, partial [Steroidobacteraceae bacterium]
MTLVESQRRSRMEVPLLDLKLQYQSLRGEIEAALEEVCAGQAFILGPAVKALERQIAAYSGCRHGIGVSSGTDALLVALMALEIGPGDEVITSPYTFFASGGTIARLGARPLFCDIDPVTFNIAPGAVRRMVTERCEVKDGALRNRATGGRVAALMPVHLYGQIAEMAPLVEIAREHALPIIEDAA